MTILAIESTFDETGVAVVRKMQDVRSKMSAVEVVSNVVATSSEMHEKYGGVVPEVAAREQVSVILPVIQEALQSSGVRVQQLEAIAVANGPGLVGSLLVGVETAKTLAYVYDKPLLAVNHMKAHVLANWIKDQKTVDSRQWTAPELPAVALVVSGGHTDLIYMESIEKWKWLGGTRDDAAGECFDKCARTLGLPYPGGPSIQRAAESVGSRQRTVDRLPRPLKNEDTYDMSFSGLKSAVLREMQDLRSKMSEVEIQRIVPSLAKEVNEAIVESLVVKTMKAVEDKNPKSLLLAGGVAANALLRQSLDARCQMLGVRLFSPELKYCTDNAAMIGAAAVMSPQKTDVFGLKPEPGLEVV